MTKKRYLDSLLFQESRNLKLHFFNRKIENCYLAIISYTKRNIKINISSILVIFYWHKMVFSTYLINVRCSMKFQKGSNWPLTNSDRQDPPNRIKNIIGHKPQTIKFYKISKLTLDNDMNDINSELKATLVEPCLIVSYAKWTKFMTKEGDNSICLRLHPKGFISYIYPLLLVKLSPFNYPDPE